MRQGMPTTLPTQYTTRTPQGGISLDRAVAYIDLLGFRNLLTNDNLKTAISLFENYNAVLVGNQSYLNAGFESLLPMSDSIILTARDPDRLLPILSNFIIECFLFTSGAYQNVRPGQDPTVVDMPIVTPSGVKSNQEKWPPTLFRGGVSFGEFVLTTQQALEASAPTIRRNVAGQAYLRAVQLEEQKVKGPRILIDDSAADLLSDPLKRYVLWSEAERCYEILWPAFVYDPKADPQIELNNFTDLFSPASVLYLYFREFSFRDHYLQLLRLIVKSALRFFEDTANLANAKEHILDVIRQRGLENELLGVVTTWGQKPTWRKLTTDRLKLWWSRVWERTAISSNEFVSIFRKPTQ